MLQCGRVYQDECPEKLPLKWVFQGSYWAGVPVFCPSPRVGGCYIHPLSATVFVNDMAWVREGQCLDRTRMDGWMDVRDVVLKWLTLLHGKLKGMTTLSTKKKKKMNS